MELILLTSSIALLAIAIVLIFRNKANNQSGKTDLFSGVVHTMPQTIIVLDNNNRVVVSRNLSRFISIPESYDTLITGRTASELSQESDKPYSSLFYDINCAVDDFRRSNKVQNIKNVHNSIPYTLTVAGLEHKGVVCYLLNDDVSKQTSLDEYEIAFAVGGITSWVFDINEKRFVSSHFNEVFGDSIMYDDLIERIHPKYRDVTVFKLQELIEKRVSRIDLTIYIRNNKGNMIWVEVNATTFNSVPNGDVLKIVGSQRNVTNEVGINKRIAQSQMKLKMAVQSGGMQQWEYTYSSKLFTVSQGDILPVGGMSFEKVMSYIHPDDLQYFEIKAARMRSGEDTIVKADLRMAIESQFYRWYSFNITLFERDDDGMPAGVIGLIQDITDRVKMNNELAYLRDKAEESNRLKSAFLANMSHEIRTPLNAIVGFSNLMTLTDDDDEKQQYSAIIEQNNELLLTLIDDILDLSKIESGKIEFNYTAINVNVLLSQLSQSSQLKARKGVVVVATPMDNSEFMIEADMQRLTQVLANFLNNAVKFTTKGEIKLSCKIIGENVRFAVKDSGIGITPENLEKVFQRFFKLNTNIPGTGLGLSICETIVRMMGGSIGASSEVGVGSEFWCIVPIRRALFDEPDVEVTPVETTVEGMQIPVSKARGLNRKILIGEDNSNNYLLFEKILSNYELIHAENGVEAIEKFITEMPNMIIMDLNMPEMDGFEAVEILRRQDPYIPIIAVSGSIMPQDRSLALSNGFTDFLSKPVDRKLLLAVVAEYMDGTHSKLA